MLLCQVHGEDRFQALSRGLKAPSEGARTRPESSTQRTTSRVTATIPEKRWPPHAEKSCLPRVAWTWANGFPSLIETFPWRERTSLGSRMLICSYPLPSKTPRSTFSSMPTPDTMAAPSIPCPAHHSSRDAGKASPLSNLRSGDPPPVRSLKCSSFSPAPPSWGFPSVWSRVSRRGTPAGSHPLREQVCRAACMRGRAG